VEPGVQSLTRGAEGDILECLKGILLVLAMIALLGSGSPMGPKKILCRLFSRGMNI
jgi:hypothetical protein